MTIMNPFASHLTRHQHAKLAAHYHQRYEQMARWVRLSSFKHRVEDYHTMFHKYLYHKRAAETLATIEAQERTAAALMALSLGAVS